MAINNWDDLFTEASREFSELEWDVVEADEIRVMAQVYLPSEDRTATFEIVGLEPDADILFINLGAEVEDAR